AAETSLLLNAGPEGTSARPPQASTSSPSATLSLEPQVDPTHRILKESTGLRPSFMDEYMVYTAAAGDTWPGLAQRRSQDGQYTRNLLRANDEMPTPVTGTQVLVPVFDLITSDAGLQPGSEASAPAAPAGLAASTAPSTRLPEVAPVTGKALEYEVQA